MENMPIRRKISSQAGRVACQTKFLGCIIGGGNTEVQGLPRDESDLEILTSTSGLFCNSRTNK